MNFLDQTICVVGGALGLAVADGLLTLVKAKPSMVVSCWHWV